MQQPIVLWSLEGALLRADHTQSMLASAVHTWMGNPAEVAAEAQKQWQTDDSLTDNEVVRQVLRAAGIEPYDWMVRGVLGHHERSLREMLSNPPPALAIPGVEHAIRAVARAGAMQLLISRTTECAASAKLRSAKLHSTFEIPRGEPGAGHLRGIFTSERGNFAGLMYAFRRWAQDASITFISASPREIMVGIRVGANCIGVTSAGAAPKELSSAGAQMVITERTGLENIHQMIGLDRFAAPEMMVATG